MKKGARIFGNIAGGTAVTVNITALIKNISILKYSLAVLRERYNRVTTIAVRVMVTVIDL